MISNQRPEGQDEQREKDLKAALNHIDKSTKAVRLRFFFFIVATVKTTMVPHETLRLCYQAGITQCMPIEEGKCPYYLLTLFYVYLTEIRMEWKDYRFLNVVPITDEERAVLFLNGFPDLTRVMNYKKTRNALSRHLSVIRRNMLNMLECEKCEGAETDFAKLILPRWVLLYEHQLSNILEQRATTSQ